MAFFLIQIIGERSEPLSRVFNDQPRDIYGGVRTYVRFLYACACTHECLPLERNVC